MKTGTHFPEVKEYNRPAGAQGGPAMKRKQGFTLVELLVVMAIIAILAAIVVPNVQRYIVRARVTRAIAEINGVELAMTAMLTDSGKGNLNQLFNGNAVRTLVGAMALDPTNEQFMRMTDLYTAVIYDLLRYGRNVLRGDGDADEAFGFTYGAPLNPDPLNGVPPLIDKAILAKLGTNYMDLGADPWGNEYKIFAGPWKTAANPSGGRAPIPFRKFTAEGTRGARKDNFQIDDTMANPIMDIVDDAATWPPTIGYPADTGKAFYIWSFGENNESSQMLYMADYPTGQENAYLWYNAETGEDIAGGDDINNWDPAATWQRFYN